MAGRYYIDTSAYLCILLGEQASAEVQARIRGGLLLSSALMVLEVDRNLVRLSREGILSPSRLQDCRERLEKDLEQFILRDLSLDLCRDRTMPVVTTPRSLDLVHLRTALWFHRREPLTAFVTTDDPQRTSARELGLPV